MSRGEHVTAFEVQRIRELAALGMPMPRIAKRLGRSKSTVWRVLRDGLAEQKPKSPVATCPLETKLASSLEIGIVADCTNQEARVSTPDEIRTNFIEALTAHFVVRRRAPERFIEDLIAALMEEGFSVPVLKRAAHTFVKTRTASGFPSVAACIGMCHEVRQKLSSEMEAIDA
ncbi:MAG: helix-turn-helix domain-containing protein [Proteobacteria bacterium]|nr:helix-turn-helix domain-containing protein [Pseudomonadota bacterium]